MKKNKFQPKESVHYSVKNRKTFKLHMWLIFLGLVLILCGCAACFYFGTVTWDPDKGFEPGANVQYWWQALLITVGAVVSVGSIVAYVLICYSIFGGFYRTQAAYWKTAEFKKARAKAKNMDLFKLKKKDLKWYKKLGYVNSDEFKNITEARKLWIKNCKQDKKKINYAKSKA